ncbi:MAG: FAD-binding oxidoreductase [Actinomycetota bacterium]|nr:FAD-binding oxidoreductase [Actinomycetota bacterium]
MATAEAVIIGGGCVGTSVSYHLAALGCSDTLLLEADALGSGSTSKAAGGIRIQHDQEVNSRIVLRSLEEFTAFEVLTETPIDFKQVGYLFVLDSEDQLVRFTRAARTQQSLGVPTEIIAPEDIAAFSPGLFTEDLVGATFCPLEGYAAPEAVVQGYAKAARRLGARIRVNTPVVEILTDANGVCGVRTAADTTATRNVIVAAGVRTGQLTAPLGYEVPVEGVTRTIFYTSKDAGVPEEAPLVVDFGTGFYYHREGAGLLFAGRESELEKLVEPATHRLPALADVPIETSWWGYYDMSPDHNAIVGAAPIDGLFYATGFSGHGFMQSPAVGEHVAELVLRRPTTLDLSSISNDRFGQGHTHVESFVI